MLQNAFTNGTAEGADFAITCNEVYCTSGDGLWSDVAKDVRVTGMGMYISTEKNNYNFFSDSDFYVTYDESTWDNMRDGLIYTDSTFLAHVHEKMYDVLLQLGCDEELAHTLVADITYSEQGMQDNGRVSCDAYKLADYLRTLYVGSLITA